MMILVHLRVILVIPVLEVLIPVSGLMTVFVTKVRIAVMAQTVMIAILVHLPIIQVQAHHIIQEHPAAVLIVTQKYIMTKFMIYSIFTIPVPVRCMLTERIG